MPQSNMITAFRKDTGAQVRVPAHWLDHPTLSAPFRKTKPSSAPTPAPATNKTTKES